jgi:hypothetical protein
MRFLLLRRSIQARSIVKHRPLIISLIVAHFRNCPIKIHLHLEITVFASTDECLQMRPGKAKQRKTDNYKAPDEKNNSLSLSLSLSLSETQKTRETCSKYPEFVQKSRIEQSLMGSKNECKGGF